VDLEIIAAIVGVVTGLGGLAVSFRTARSTVRKSEIETLDMMISRLQEENRRLCGRVDDLEGDNKKLRQELDAVKDENAKLRKRVDELEKERQQLLEELEWDDPLSRGSNAHAESADQPVI
jgi:predicted nuclease with TOPRIM domain